MIASIYELSTNSNEISVSNLPNSFKDLTKQVLGAAEVNPIKTGSLEEQIEKFLKKSLCQSEGIIGGISKQQSRRKSFKSNDFEVENDGKDRKQRENFNDRITELMGLIPQEFLLIDKHELMLNEDRDLTKSSINSDAKPYKGQILTNSVRYINYLQDRIDKNNQIEVELMSELETLNPTYSSSLTSAEIALGDIGVGKYSDQYFIDVLQRSSI